MLQLFVKYCMTEICICISPQLPVILCILRFQYWCLFQYFKVAILIQNIKKYIYWKHILLYDGVNYLQFTASLQAIYFSI